MPIIEEIHDKEQDIWDVRDLTPMGNVNAGTKWKNNKKRNRRRTKVENVMAAKVASI